MIAFVEKEPFISTPNFTPTRQKLIPVWMVKDDAEYFVANISVAGGNYSEDFNRREMEAYKAHLIQTGGKYFKFYDHSRHNSPEEMIASIIEHGHTFDKVGEFTPFCEAPEGQYGPYMAEFQGNRREVYAAFHFRIYDREYAGVIQELIKPIIERSKRR